MSIVLPVHDQADHIGTIVEEYEGALAGIASPHEIVLIPNGCRDDSVQVCRELAARWPSLRVIPSDGGGWGLAVKLGLREARGDLLCYTNSARTSAKDLTLLLLYAVAYPGTVVKANRKIRESWPRRLGSLLYNLECRSLYDLSYWDINGTPKVFPREFDHLLELRREDDLIDLEFNLVCRRESYPMIEVPIFSVRRHGGNSTTNLRSAAKLYWGAYRLRRSMRLSG